MSIITIRKTMSISRAKRSLGLISLLVMVYWRSVVAVTFFDVIPITL
ncbi:MAG: hypothetical protein LBE12_12145 [Planctomycetaceae bacterium]|nr:hypothetical protein [Planctomycetaceae bacterium]